MNAAAAPGLAYTATAITYLAMAQARRDRLLLPWHPRRVSLISYAILQKFYSHFTYLPLAMPVLVTYNSSERARYAGRPPAWRRGGASLSAACQVVGPARWRRAGAASTSATARAAARRWTCTRPAGTARRGR